MKYAREYKGHSTYGQGHIQKGSTNWTKYVMN